MRFIPFHEKEPPQGKPLIVKIIASIGYKDGYALQTAETIREWKKYFDEVDEWLDETPLVKPLEWEYIGSPVRAALAKALNGNNYEVNEVLGRWMWWDPFIREWQKCDDALMLELHKDKL